MRVLHVVTLHTPDNAFGGPLRVAQNLATGLRGRGVDARMLALADGFDGAPPRHIGDVPALLYPARHVLPQFEVSGIISPSMLLSAHGLVRGADVVHVHLMRDLITLPMAVAARAAGVPLVLQTHGMVDPSDKPLANLLDRLAVRRLLCQADVLTYLTDTERQHQLAVARTELGNQARLVNGVAPARRRELPDAPPLVVYVARMQQRKRPEEFVKAIPGVLAKVPQARFVLAGPDSGSAAGVLELIDRLGVADAVRYVGALDHDEVLKLLGEATVSVLPSIEEPFPMSVLEGMSVGVPQVVTTTNGLSRDIRRVGAGRVVGDDCFAPAIVELLDPAVNEAASRAAWELTRETFSIDGVLSRLQGLYQRAVDRRGTGG